MWQSEKKFAELLTKQKREWVYPAKRFNLGKTTYRPDFFLPNEKLYIEVIGTRQAYHTNKDKIDKFKKLYPYIKFIIVDSNGKTFIPKSILNTMENTILTRVSKQTYSDLKTIALKDNRSLSYTIRKAIIQYLKRRMVKRSTKRFLK